MFLRGPYSNRLRIPGLNDDDSSSGSDDDEQEDEEDDDEQPLQHQDEQDEEDDDDDDQHPLQHQHEQDDDLEQPPLQHQDQQDDDHEQPPLQHQDQDPHDQEVFIDGSKSDEDNDLDSRSRSEICEEDYAFSSDPRVNPARPLAPSASDVQSMTHARRPKVNLEELSTESLSKYCKHYNIAGINSDSSREDMLNAVEQHFATQPPLDEMQVIDDFLAHESDQNSPKDEHSDSD